MKATKQGMAAFGRAMIPLANALPEITNAHGQRRAAPYSRQAVSQRLEELAAHDRIFGKRRSS